MVALGAVSWAAARGRGAAAVPVLQPAAALVSCVLNSAAADGAPMKKRLVAFMDELSRT